MSDNKNIANEENINSKNDTNILLRDILSSYTKTNGKLLGILSSFKNDEEKTSILRLIKVGTDLSKILNEISKRNTRIPLWTREENINEKTDKFSKFKNLMVPAAFSIDSSLYTDGKNYWHLLKNATLINIQSINSKTMLELLKKFKSLSLNPIKGITVISDKIINVKDGIENNLLIKGEKKIIKELTKNFTNQLSMLGFDVSEISQFQKKEKFLNKEELDNNINFDLSNKYNISFTDNEITFNLIKELSDEMKFEFLSKVLTPKVQKDLVINMNLIEWISELTKKNKYINQLIKFSEKNNLNTDMVVHMLKNKDELLNDFIGINQIKLIKNDILENINKYENITNASILYLENLLNIIETVKKITNELNLNPSSKKIFIENLDNKLLSKDGFNYLQIKRNFSNIKKESILDINVNSNKPK